MSNLVNGIVFYLASTKDFENKDLARKIIDVLIAAPKSIKPSKYGVFRPDSKIEGSENLVDILVNAKGAKSDRRAGSLIVEASKACGFQIQWNKSLRQNFPFVSGHLMFSAIEKNEQTLCDFLKVVKELVKVLSPSYGEIRSMSVKGWDAPLNLLLRLPDIPPISIYGREYIALFGKDRIENAPFMKIEKIGECYWLVSHDSLRDSVPDAKRAIIRSYFGENSFMANGKWKYTDGHAPKFNLPNEEK